MREASGKRVWGWFSPRKGPTRRARDEGEAPGPRAPRRPLKGAAFHFSLHLGASFPRYPRADVRSAGAPHPPPGASLPGARRPAPGSYGSSSPRRTPPPRAQSTILKFMCSDGERRTVWGGVRAPGRQAGPRRRAGGNGVISGPSTLPKCPLLCAVRHGGRVRAFFLFQFYSERPGQAGVPGTPPEPPKASAAAPLPRARAPGGPRRVTAGSGGAVREAAAVRAGRGNGPFGSLLRGLLFASASCAKIVYP